MEYLRKMQNVNKAGRFPTVSIPSALVHLFPSDYVIIAPLENGMGAVLLPAEAKPIFSGERGAEVHISPQEH
jgi:hypothetical protein